MGVTGSRETEVAKISKSSMTALIKRAEEIPLTNSSIGARDVQVRHEPIPGPNDDTDRVE